MIITRIGLRLDELDVNDNQDMENESTIGRTGGYSTNKTDKRKSMGKTGTKKFINNKHK